jgi:hypothetical protein
MRGAEYCKHVLILVAGFVFAKKRGFRQVRLAGRVRQVNHYSWPAADGLALFGIAIEFAPASCSIRVRSNRPEATSSLCDAKK